MTSASGDRQQAPEPGVSNTIGADAPCVRCGYNLRGLSPEHHCPECGLGVARSMALGRELHDSRPAWIASLAWAAWLLLATQVLLVALVLVLVCVQAPAPVIVALLSAAFVAHAAGACLLTRPENPHARSHPSRGWSLALRACTVPPPVFGLLLLVLTLADRPLSGMLHGVFEVTSLLAALAVVPCPLLEFLLLRRLARRVLDESLAEHAAIVGWGYTLTLAVLLACPLIVSWTRFQPSENLTFGLMLALVTALLLFWIWAATLLTIAGVTFTRGARKARELWLRADGARDSLPSSTPAGATALATDTPCVRCGCNLRSLGPEQTCPECGLGIAQSRMPAAAATPGPP